MFLKILKFENIPLPVKEFRFCERRWKFDYAWPEFKIACEQEGAVWVSGRHTRGSGFVKDMEKYNKAVILGWRVLRYTPEQMLSEAIRDLKIIFEGVDKNS